MAINTLKLFRYSRFGVHDEVEGFQQMRRSSQEVRGVRRQSGEKRGDPSSFMQNRLNPDWMLKSPPSTAGNTDDKES